VGKPGVATKFAPVIVTSTLLPNVAPAGEKEVTVGTAGITVNCTKLEVVTPSVVTNTVCAPIAAYAAIVKVAVIVVSLVTVGLFAVIPVPLKVIEAGLKKFVPVSVSEGVVAP